MALTVVEPRTDSPLPAAGSRTLIIVGSDGSGKTTTINALVDELVRDGIAARIVANPAGRRWFTRQFTDKGRTIPVRMLDLFESCIRMLNVAVNSFTATRFDGLTVMDRHLHCQLVLRRLRGQPAGLLLPKLAKHMVRESKIIVLDVDPALAQERIVARAEDFETLEYLVSSRREYLTMAAQQGWTVIDASGTVVRTVRQIRNTLGC